jgi:D-inositol-3-phosphate glycosyltransferase
VKVVLFGPAPPWRGGVPLFTNTLARELTKAGHDVHIVGFAKLFPRALFPGKSQLDDSPTAVRCESERVVIPWRRRTWKEAARTIAKHEPDVIAAMWWMPPFAFGYRALFRALPKELQNRFVYIIHDVVSHERFPGDAWLAKLALKESLRFLILSRAVEQRLIRLLPETRATQVVFAPHPLYEDLRPFAGTAEEARAQLGVTAPRVLLFFGFIRRYKGLDILLRALPEIRARCGDVQLLVCGPFHQNRARYEKLMAQLGIAAHVVVQDRYFSGNDVAPCFAAADAVVLPYRSATQTGVAPMAFALGTPVIATRVGGLAEAVTDGETGFLVEPDNPRKLAEAVERFYARGGKTTLAARIDSAARRFSWAELINAVIRFAAGANECAKLRTP